MEVSRFDRVVGRGVRTPDRGDLSDDERCRLTHRFYLERPSIVLVVVLMLSMTGCNRAEGEGPAPDLFSAPTNGLIVFGDGDINFLDGEVQHQGRVIGAPADGLFQVWPDVSPDGRLLAYLSVPELRRSPLEVVVTEIDAFGQALGERWRIRPEDRFIRIDHLAWSPDGTSLSYLAQSALDPPSELRLIDADDGSGIALLSDQIVLSDLSWSPDGRTLAVGMNAAVWLVPTDGADPTRLTDDSAVDGVAWSPDGTLIAFSATSPGPKMEALPPFGVSPRPTGIHVMFPDGTGRRLLTQGFLDSAPAWSPDGKRIAFIRFKCAHDRCGVIAVMNRDGTGLVELRLPEETKLLLDVGHFLGFSWSPDSQIISYIAVNEDDEETGVIVSVVPDPDVDPVVLGKVNLRHPQAEADNRLGSYRHYRRQVDWQPIYP
jgi:WD40 repeat protein